MKPWRLFRKRKSRKYPIKWDERGRSARSRCFEMFAEKIPLEEIAQTVGGKIKTVQRYHRQWKKDPGFEGKYFFTRAAWLTMDSISFLFST